MPNYTSLIEMSTENFIHGDMKTLVIITITTPYRHFLTRNLLRALSIHAGSARNQSGDTDHRCYLP